MSEQTVAEVIDLLYGGGGADLIRKMNPTQSDVATTDQRKRRITAGLSAVGATAGALGLGYAAKEMHAPFKAGAAKAGLAGAGRLKRIGSGLKTAAKDKPFASALLPAEVVGLGGEVASTHILHNDTKQKKPGSFVQKDLGELVNNASEYTSKKKITRAVITSPKARNKGNEYVRRAGGQLRKLPVMQGHADVEKRDDSEVDVIWEGEFAKADGDKQQVFGWASVVEVDGQPVVDLQGDLISIDEMEKAAYSYVQKSRKGGDMHLRNNWEPIQKSEMIESFIVTPDKRDAMGLPDSVPAGWWVGFQVQDPQVWADIKAGRRTGFSIHGHGRRTPTEA